MLYLLTKIAFFLIAALALGFGVGWYVRQAGTAKREAELNKKLNTARSHVPQLEASLRNQNVVTEQIKKELESAEDKFGKAGNLIGKRDKEILERDRRISSLTQSLEVLKNTPNDSGNLEDVSFELHPDLVEGGSSPDEDKLEAAGLAHAAKLKALQEKSELELADLVAQLEQAKKQSSTLEEELGKLAKHKLADEQSAERAAGQKHQTLTNKVNELEAALSSATQNQKAVEGLELKFQDQKKKIVAMEQLERDQAENLVTLEEMLAEKQFENDKNINERNSAEQKLKQLSDEVSDLRSAEYQHEADLANMEREVRASKDGQQSVKESLAAALKASERIVELEQEILELNRQSVQQSAQDAELLKEAHLDTDRMSVEFAGLQERLQGAQKENAELLTVLDNQAKGLHDDKQSLTAAETRITELETDLDKSKQAQLKLASGYNEGLKARKKLVELEEHKPAPSRENPELDTLKQQLDVQAGEKRELAIRLNDQITVMDKLEHDRDLQQKSLEILKQQLDDARGSEDRHVQKYRAMEAELESLESKELYIADQASKLADARAQIESLKNAISAKPQAPAVTSEKGEPAILYTRCPSQIDDLKQIKGIGAAAEKQLHELGIYHFQQIAGLDASNVDWVEKHLTKFKGRLRRDDWMGQALHLNTSADDASGSASAFI